MPARVRPGVDWRIPSLYRRRRCGGEPKGVSIRRQSPGSCEMCGVVTSFDTAGAGILNFQDFPQRPAPNGHHSPRYRQEGQDMVALIFLSVIAAVFVAVVALEGGDPSLERRPKGLLTWIASGNWPAKIGGALIVVGVGALLRYAAINFDVPAGLQARARHRRGCRARVSPHSSRRPTRNAASSRSRSAARRSVSRTSRRTALLRCSDICPRCRAWACWC